MIPDPLERFEEEHQEALRELTRMEKAAARLEAGGDPADCVRILREVHAFVSGAVRRHNENEERALFPLLGEEASGGAFAEEHAALRTLERDLQGALDRGEPRDAARAAFALSDLLRDHIRREDGMLFPMARELLGPDGLREVARRLDAGS